MHSSLTNLDLAIKQRIFSINLDDVVARLVKIYNWPKKSALAVMLQYKNFLFLKVKYGKKHLIPPSVEIDEFWHNHIIHTAKYYQDCLFICGEYLHHQPQHSVTNQVTQSEFKKLFEEETQKLYRQEFGEYIYSVL